MRIDLIQGVSKKDLKSFVGEFMLPVETAFYAETKVQELLEALEVMDIRKELRHFYLTDVENKLIGVVPTRSILFSKRSKRLIDICEEQVVKVHEKDLLETALRKMVDHELLSLPVVNIENCLIGVLEIIPQHLEASLVSSKEERRAARELFQLIGFIPEQMELDSPLNEYRYRMPWLFCNLFAGLACAVIGNIYKETLDHMVVVAMFIPLVLTLGEAVAVQSMSLSLQFMHATKLNARRCVMRVLTEAKVSVLLGLSCIFFTGLLYWYWQSGIILLLGLSGSILLGLIFAAAFGTTFPILLRSLSFDPKVAGGPVVLMCTDIAVTAIYLSLTTRLLIHFH